MAKYLLIFRESFINNMVGNKLYLRTYHAFRPSVFETYKLEVNESLVNKHLHAMEG